MVLKTTYNTTGTGINLFTNYLFVYFCCILTVHRVYSVLHDVALLRVPK